MKFKEGDLIYDRGQLGCVIFSDEDKIYVRFEDVKFSIGYEESEWDDLVPESVYKSKLFKALK